MKRRIPLDQIPVAVREYREQLVVELRAAVSYSMRPIISVDGLSGQPSPEASCILINGWGHRFLLSAAHVLKRLRERHSLQVLAEGGFVPLSAGQVVDTPNNLDAALITLPSDKYPQFDDNDFLPISYLDPDDITTEDRIYTALGFPVSHVRTNDTGKHMTMHPIACTGRGRPAVLKHLRLSPDTHIAMEFERTLSLIRGGGYETIPVPEGMSGGPVFRLDRSGQGEHRLVGIVTDWPNGARDSLIAAHIGICLGAMKKLIPTLPIRFADV